MNQAPTEDKSNTYNKSMKKGGLDESSPYRR
jgi:hypothetical protein